MENEKLIRLHVAKVRKAWDDLGGAIEELEQLVAGHKTTGQVANDLIRDFCAAWSGHYRHEAYVPNWSKDNPSMKRLLHAFDATEIRTRIGRYLASREPFYVDARHPMGMFFAAINKFAGGEDGELELTSAPVDCRHTPRCRTDADHTARKLREARA